MIQNRKGQSMIESIALMGVVSLFVILLLKLSLTGYAYFWGRYILHEALICIAEGSTARLCEDKSIRLLQNVNLGFIKNQLELENNPKRITGKVTMTIYPNIDLQLKQELLLPLIKNL